MLGHYNSWPEAVLGRFNTALTPRLLMRRSSSTYTKVTLLSNFEPFQALFNQNRGNFERFQQNIKDFGADSSDLSGFKSEGAVKGVRGGVRTGNEGVRTHQHLARRGVRTF